MGEHCDFFSVEVGEIRGSATAACTSLQEEEYGTTGISARTSSLFQQYNTDDDLGRYFGLAEKWKRIMHESAKSPTGYALRIQPFGVHPTRCPWLKLANWSWPSVAYWAVIFTYGYSRQARFMPFWKPHWCSTEAKAILTSVLLQLQEITCLSVSIMLLVSLTFGIHRGLLLAIIFDILIAFVSAVPPPHGNPQDVVLPCEFMGVSSFSQTFL